MRVGVGVGVGLMLMLGLMVGLMVGLMLGLMVGLMVGLMLMLGLVDVHPVGALIVSSMRLTPPVLASSRPLIVADDSTEIDAEARMLPANSDPVSMVAELPTCQNTSHAEAPLISTKSVAVTDPTGSADGTWNTNTGSVSFSPFSVIGPPFTSRLDDAL
jgi:predicted lipid-binding transport protein (Tim44 family)